MNQSAILDLASLPCSCLQAQRMSWWLSCAASGQMKTGASQKRAAAGGAWVRLQPADAGSVQRAACNCTLTNSRPQQEERSSLFFLHCIGQGSIKQLLLLLPARLPTRLPACRHKRLRGGSSKQGPRSSRALQRNQRTSIITQYNRDTHAFIRRRMRVIDPDAILQLRVPPPPLPLSWGKAIKPFRQRLAEQGGPRQQQQQQRVPAAPRGLLRHPLAQPASRNCEPINSSSLPPGEGLLHAMPLPPCQATQSLGITPHCHCCCCPAAEQ